MKAHRFKQFVLQMGSLTARQRACVAERLGKVAPAPAPLAARASAEAMIEAVRAPRRACPRCQSSKVYRDGHADGLQRYRCAACKRSFNDLSGTALARLRLRGKWLDYLDAMLDSRTVRRAAALVGVHRNTSFRWRHRFLADTKHDRRLPVNGTTEVDETYLLESQKGARQMDRPPRKRGGKAKLPGLSHEQVCVLVGRERSGNTVDFVTGRAPLTLADLRRHLQPVAGRALVLVTDGHRAYRAYARLTGVAHHAINQSAGARVDGSWHLQNVNAYHSRFKQWLARFHGVATRYLANYLGWRWALDGGRIASPEALLCAALAAFPDLTGT